MTSTTTVVSFRQPETIDDPLTAVLRSGARRLLAQAIEAEAEAFLASMKDKRLADGRERVVRHGYGPERQVQTGIGPVAVQRVLAAARIRVNPATGPLPFPNACEIVLVVRRGSSQPPTPMAECGWVTDPNQRWPSAPAFGG